MHAKKNEELAFVFGDDKNMTKTLTVDDEDDRAGNLGHQHYFQPHLGGFHLYLFPFDFPFNYIEN